MSHGRQSLGILTVALCICGVSGYRHAAFEAVSKLDLVTPQISLIFQGASRGAMFARLARSSTHGWSQTISSAVSSLPGAVCGRRELYLPSINLEQSFSAAKRVPYSQAQVRRRGTGARHAGCAA